MKGAKCSIVFMRKVGNRLATLEERYGNPSNPEYEKNAKKRAHLINKSLLDTFCVDSRAIFAWKQALKVMKNNADICTIQPSHAMEIAKLPEEKQAEVIKEVSEQELSIKETKILVNNILENKNTKLTQEEIVRIETDIHTLFGDFREKGNTIPDNSINLILTDPPYGGEWLKLWDALGNLAKRVLVPSGFLVAYSGELYLSQVYASLSKHLDYYWTLALKLKSRNLVNTRNIYNLWKPIIVYQKPPLTTPPEYLCDFIDGLGAEKNGHPWQQEESEIYHLIGYFCPQNGTVLDPMAGAGTTLVAAKKLQRQFIGIELDSQNFPTIKERLKA